MSKQGDVLVSYNNQLVKCIDEMREKMDTVTKKIAKLEEEKSKITENSPFGTIPCSPMKIKN